MSEFNNVTVAKAANIYFDGQVTSRTLTFADGSRKTLGIMQPGTFEFGTQAAERMEILSGELDVQLPGEDGWQRIRGGESFDVPADSKFSVCVLSLTDYCCSFLP
ncbi:pyrimidine/purine nucleoside phosphorylase [Allochromatium humboldtianum]|uniref:Pyrimidine/purine nucleoside phosphorylase n=1 Tax=Allochromatium humboldtianum TaxID=504901 RepID=A0A850RC06_9GAMM|nr:pyrimidine/purine nucleoside phosphorylase [Allochromatium humboldtianum]NVZ08500.1 pyrimidine/purine nucleoside phosphorylase [Allochromatium humboldtianum]